MSLTGTMEKYRCFLFHTHRQSIFAFSFLEDSDYQILSRETVIVIVVSLLLYFLLAKCASSTSTIKPDRQFCDPIRNQQFELLDTGFPEFLEESAKMLWRPVAVGLLP